MFKNTVHSKFYPVHFQRRAGVPAPHACPHHTLGPQHTPGPPELSQPPQVRPPDSDKEVPLFKEGGALVSHIYPAQNKALVDVLQAKKLTALSGFSCLLLLRS